MSVRSFLLRFSRVLALVLLSMVVAALNPNFLKISNLINILRQASPQIIISAGMTIVLLTGGIDLSMGSVVTLASIVAGYVLTQTKLHWTLAIVSALGSGVLCGLVSGLLVAKVKLPSAIATYGMLWVGRGLAFAIMGAFPYFGFPNAFRYIGRGILLGIPVPIWIMSAISLMIYLFLRYTTLGRSIYAVGANPYAAKASGLRIDRILIYTYMLSGVLAGLGGIILTARLNAVDQDIGAPFLLPAIASPVMGGTSMTGGRGGIGGTIIGTLIMTVLVNAMNLLRISSLWQQFAIGLVVVLAVWLDTWIKKKTA